MNGYRKWIDSDMDLMNEFLQYRPDVLVKEVKEYEVLSIVGPYCSNFYDLSKTNEDTFAKDTLIPIIKSYFSNDHLISAESANGEIIGSKKMFKSEAGVPPRAGSGDYLIKAAICLKDCMDRSVRDGVNSNDLELVKENSIDMTLASYVSPIRISEYKIYQD
ncbi:hypothetical protein BDA99DRAFT_533785 [Phascolomyces articulosus]|uniref:Uncharacterized protein n=1 Tax=Phascolomyces articulosus TaxID=60185 RepID=A0AAD5KIS1_9FUNG|nr:hypothetical protein BDA99DRAFT_533785 [Phascolomyces articulosus]